MPGMAIRSRCSVRLRQSGSCRRIGACACSAVSAQFVLTLLFNVSLRRLQEHSRPVANDRTTEISKTTDQLIELSSRTLSRCTQTVCHRFIFLKSNTHTCEPLAALHRLRTPVRSTSFLWLDTRLSELSENVGNLFF